MIFSGNYAPVRIIGQARSRAAIGRWLGSARASKITAENTGKADG